MERAKKSRKAPPRRTQTKFVLAQEMEVADSSEVTEDAIIIPVPPETVSTAVKSSQCSNSLANDLDRAETCNANVVEQLQRQSTLPELKAADREEKLVKMVNENEILLGRQFSLDKIKDDNSAIQFYTGFPCYEALISFFKYPEPKLGKMQYWKGEHLMRERQPYREDGNRNKPGPSRKLTFLDEFLLALMRLKAGLFVQDLADKFGVSTSLVSRICLFFVFKAVRWAQCNAHLP